MTVLIFHPTEELKLIQFQKQLLSEVNCEKNIYYGAIPLWLPLNHPDFSADDEKNLKSLSKKIKNINVTSIFSDSQNNISIEFSILTQNNEYKFTLPFIKPYKICDDKKSDLKKECPVKSIKIFRLGICVEPSQNSKAISDSVWCKLKA